MKTMVKERKEGINCDEVQQRHSSYDSDEVFFLSYRISYCYPLCSHKKYHSVFVVVEMLYNNMTLLWMSHYYAVVTLHGIVVFVLAEGCLLS